MTFFSYWFWPNPGGWDYSDPRVLALAGVCALLIVASFVLRYWRRSIRNPATRTLSRSWSAAALWFGFAGLVLIVCRVESIQFLAMRAAWVLWLLLIVLFVAFQVLQFRRKHYTVMDRVKVIDEREKYLPRKR